MVKDPYLVRCFLAAKEMAKGLDIDGASSWGVEDATAFELLRPEQHPMNEYMGFMWIADRWMFNVISSEEDPLYIYSFRDIDRNTTYLEGEQDLSPFLKRPRMNEEDAVTMARKYLIRLGLSPDRLVANPDVQQTQKRVSNKVGDKSMAEYAVFWPSLGSHTCDQLEVQIDARLKKVSKVLWPPEYRKDPPDD